MTSPRSRQSRPDTNRPGKPPRGLRPRPKSSREGAPSRPARPQRASEAAGLRLQKVLADAGIASRRACEEMIESGRVEVNGQIVDKLPVFVDPTVDRIAVDGNLLRLFHSGPKLSRRAQKASEQLKAERVYIMLFKPDRVIATTHDDAPEGVLRTTVLDLVKAPEGVRLFPVGRLDYHSAGLVLLTNDGVLADRLTHARYGVSKTYRVTIKGVPGPKLLEDLRRRVGKDEPMAIAPARQTPGRNSGSLAPTGQPSDGGVRIARDPGAVDSEGRAATNTVLEITLREGKNRQLKPILEQMGCNVRRIVRVGIGPLRLRGLKSGESRNLTREEVTALKLAGGMTPEGPQPRGGPRAGARPASAKGPRPGAAAASAPAAPLRRPASTGIFREVLPEKGKRS